VTTSRTEAVMGTTVTLCVVHSGNDSEVESAIERGFGWFHEIEARCTRFDPASELMRLDARFIPVSTILFEAVRFALQVAEETDGAFDPTVGHRMEELGFNREHRTGEIVRSAESRDVSWRDVELGSNSIRLRRPLTLDLGAVAKGLAIDTAARELAPLRDFSIDAGGDLYIGGTQAIGIRHPRSHGELIETLQISNQAVCTSGDYEKPGHILNSTGEVASATVIASSAMLADALSTAAFSLGPDDGLALLERMGVEGLIFTPELKRYETRGLRRAA
jgi:thiamine biosynthesis lipoprotein